MSNLRDLLGIVTDEFVKGLGGTDSTTKLPAYPSRDFHCVALVVATNSVGLYLIFFWTLLPFSTPRYSSILP